MQRGKIGWICSQRRRSEATSKRRDGEVLLATARVIRRHRRIIGVERRL